MKLRYKIGGVVAAILAVFLYGRYGKPKPVVPNVLPPNTVEQILVNPTNHTITVVTPTGSQVVTLPDHVSTIDLGTDGKITVKAPQFGWEVRPFFGAFYSDAMRFGGGVDGLYFKKLDLGLGVAGGASCHTVAFVQVGYTIWDNLKVGVTYDHLGHYGIGVSVRI